jgi:hypothetical protein
VQLQADVHSARTATMPPYHRALTGATRSGSSAPHTSRIGAQGANAVGVMHQLQTIIPTFTELACALNAHGT